MPHAPARILRLLGCLAGICLATCGSLAAPPPPVPFDQETPWRIVNLAPDAAIGRHGVADLAFEPDGTAWFAVSDGLYRYDGYQWRKFTTADGLPSNFIRAVTVTRDGELWVGTDRGAGVFAPGRFDRRGTGERLAGPNVRRIFEARDGSLWFACDRWPNAMAPGGLTRRTTAGWRTFTAGDGLPSNHVLGVYEARDGRLFALTARGPAVLAGDRFEAYSAPGFPLQEHAWNFAETADEELFVQGGSEDRIWLNGAWKPLPQEFGNAPFCVAKDGALILADHTQVDQLRFLRWNGRELLPASERVSGPGLETGDLRTAPDGAIWAIGQGTIIRWEYGPGPWQWWPGLGPPVLEDRAGRLWLADTNGAAAYQGGTVASVPELRAPLAEAADGAIWGGTTNGIARWRDGQTDLFSPAVSGLATLDRVAAEPFGPVWFTGRDSRGTTAVARWAEGRWTEPALGQLAGQDITGFTLDATNGVWLAAFDLQSLAFRILRATDGLAREVPLAAPVQTGWPRLLATADRLFLHSLNGLWEAPLGERLEFREVVAGEGAAFTEAARWGDIATFLASEGPSGGARVLVRRQADWLSHPLRFGQSLRLCADGWMLVADGSELALWNTVEWPIPSYISLPAGTVVRSQMRTRDGEYWVGTARGVLKSYDLSRRPETELLGPTQILAGTEARVQARGLSKFVPLSEPRRFSFNWRLDNQPWTGFDDWPAEGMPLGSLPPGPHLLRVQARDGVGNADPTPAELAFTIVPVPIQDRGWFRPLLLGVCGAFGLLSAALFAARVKLNRHAHELEGRVALRTAELREDILRREAAEAEILAREERARRQSDALTRLVTGGLAPGEPTEAWWDRFAEQVAHATGVAVAGVWEITADGAELRCLSQFETGSCQHTRGKVLSARDFPAYFAAIRRDGRIAANDARSDPRTVEFRDVYLVPRGITSMLDAGIQVGERLAGVICLEHLGPPRDWPLDEQAFVNAAAALAAQALAERERRLAVRALDDERLRLGAIIDAAAVGTWEWNVETGETVFNERWAAIVGYTLAELAPVSIETWNRLTHPADLAQSDALLQRHFAGELPYYECECRMRHKDGRWVWIADRGRVISRTPEGRPLMMFGTHTDVTERHRHEQEREALREQLQHSQRLESLGRLAGGVAHEFNNMLQAIRGNADLAVLELATSHPVHANLEEIQFAARRSADITKQLLAFARQQTVVPQVLDLNEAVGRSLSLLRRLISENIELLWSPGSGVWPVLADAGQLDQVLTNLCVNARDAITGSGSIRIATRNVTLDQPLAECPPGDYVLLTVEDTGKGMDAGTAARIFEPFFTTKELGKGTGLGLAIVFGVIKQSQGHIAVRSEPGSGTTFEIHLPRSRTVPEPAGETHSATAPSIATPTHRTVLLVEDEEQVLRLGVKLLRDAGYTVLAAGTPTAALELAVAHSGPIHLLVTDLVMPGMNGIQLGERLQGLRPGLPCLYISGYPLEVVTKEGLPTPTRLVQKPFTAEEFLGAIREALVQAALPGGPASGPAGHSGQMPPANPA